VASEQGVHPIKVSFQRLGQTFRELKKYRDLSMALLAFWIYANSYAIKLAEKMGLRRSLEEAGVVIRAETCMVISPIANWNFKTLMTDSGKCSYYGPAECGTDIIFAGVEECVEAAVLGRLPK